MFARATVCNLFFVCKMWCVMQVLNCLHINVQKLHRNFAVFIWGSYSERSSRTNLFRHVRMGGLSLAHLFLRQVVNRFIFLRDMTDPFLRTVCQVRLGRFLPDIVASSQCCLIGGIHGKFREVVQATLFCAHVFLWSTWVVYLGSNCIEPLLMLYSPSRCADHYIL